MPEKLNQGVVMQRKCTDAFMCLVFFLYCCGLFATAAYGYSRGDPMKILTLFDSEGNQCGNVYHKTFSYKYLLWPDIAKVVQNPLSAPNRRVCVSECLMDAY